MRAKRLSFEHVALLTWYRVARREMPWRGHASPYVVWVSEIMLQQTQVETVRPYFARFIERFPTVQALAEAETETVLSLWQGLGYYTRVRNLQRAAKMVVEHNEGRLPETAAQLMELPGIGAYTAAAIASLCFGERAPVVDGNVARVFARLFLLADDFKSQTARQKLALRLQSAFDETESPGDLNQAMMELGALICRPRNPECGRCPLALSCKARQRGEQEDYPRRLVKAKPPVRHAVAVVLRRGSRWLMVRRPEEGLLGGLWELPGGSIEEGETVEAAACRLLPIQAGLDVAIIASLGMLKHCFSHFTLMLHIVEAMQIGGRRKVSPKGTLRWISPATLSALPVATAHRRALEL